MLLRPAHTRRENERSGANRSTRKQPWTHIPLNRYGVRRRWHLRLKAHAKSILKFD